MATLIPAFNSCSQRMTSGERRFAQRLEDKLEDDYLLWYNVPIRCKRLHPDFIVLHPLRGIFVLEVKDWKISTIARINPETATLLTADGKKEEKNPLKQARDYALAVKQLLECDRLLVQIEGRYKGKLAFPVNYGVVCTNITRKQFEAEEGLQAVFEPNLVICQDETYEQVDAYEFQQRLWNLSTYEFGEPLTLTQVDRIRWHLFPEVRIGDYPVGETASHRLHSISVEELSSEGQDIQIPDLLHVMDIQQEQLARSLGDGHRVVHGVAGSGKTLILVYRCLHLVEQSSKPILVLCFNVSLAAKLRQMLHEKGIGNRVTVRHFHGWITEQLRFYRVPKPSTNEFRGAAYVEELVQRAIRAVEANIIPAARYGAVMIDEGHDFRPEWLKLAAQMVDPQTNSLLLLYDDAQSIYEQQQKRKFTFKSLGIQAQGRTTVLKINYRNTHEILTLAYEFAKEVLTPALEPEEDTPPLVHPQGAGRRGSAPQLIKLPSFQRETEYLLEQVQQFHEKGTPWNEMAIVYRALTPI
ncbi:NERD domain-containing protein [Phormidium tenue FACHB-886]|nr:NERD domain-containing protein [Phormidium tenue FACHB-886]